MILIIKKASTVQSILLYPPTHKEASLSRACMQPAFFAFIFFVSLGLLNHYTAYQGPVYGMTLRTPTRRKASSGGRVKGSHLKP